MYLIFNLSLIILDGWIGIDLTRQARRRIQRGYQILLVSKLRRGEYLYKDAYLEITTKDNIEVVAQIACLLHIVLLFRRRQDAGPSGLIPATIARLGRPLAAWQASP